MGGLFSAFGLSSAAGLNAYIPLLVVGLLARLDWIHLNAPYTILSHPVFLLVIAILALLDFVGDKIPVVDHMLHVAGVVIHPVAGALLFVAANGAAGYIPPWLAAVSGLLIALGTHGARAAVRPVATTATAGTANPVISFLEDGMSLVLSVLAVVVPALSVLLLIVVAIVLFRFFRRTLRPWGEYQSPN